MKNYYNLFNINEAGDGSLFSKEEKTITRARF
jgi:hypothetical protein